MPDKDDKQDGKKGKGQSGQNSDDDANVFVIQLLCVGSFNTTRHWRNCITCQINTKTSRQPYSNYLFLLMTFFILCKVTIYL